MQRIIAAPAGTQTAPAETEEITQETTENLDDGSGTGSGYRAILYNDDYHDFEEVIAQVRKATGCSEAQAETITLEAHFRGRAICFRGDRAQCQRVCRVLREIRLQCEVDCD